MQKLFIIDASGYIYSSYFAIRNMTNSKGESTNAIYGFIRSVNKLIKDFQPTHLVAVFDGPNNAKKRLELYPQYKMHRLEMPGDLRYQINWAREFCQLVGVPLLNLPDVEADDTMGAVAKWAEKEGTTSYLCTTDKDMCQLVNEKILLLNTRKDNQISGSKEIEENYGINPSQMIDLLALMGDASDNVPGVPGIGTKTAASLLKQYGSLDNMLDPSFAGSDKKRQIIVDNKEVALLSRQLVTIDLDVDIPTDQLFYALKETENLPLKTFYASMNFNSLIKELEIATPKNSGSDLFNGGDLFGELPLVEKCNYHLVDDEKSLSDLMAFLSTQKEICFDTETTDLRPLQAELVGIGFAVKANEAWYIPVNGTLGQQKVLEAVKPLFQNQKIGFYAHNGKYDYHVMLNHGIEIATLSFDTLVASYLLNSHQRLHSLDQLTLEYFGKVKIAISDLIGKGKSMINMREVPIDKVCNYCCEDVDYTVRLKTILEAQLKERSLEKLFREIELPLLKVLANMERRGIYLDAPHLSEIALTVNQQIKRLEQEIYLLAGEEFNINSPKQLSHILQNKLMIPLPKKTATGFSTNAEILEELKHTYPIAETLLEYRGAEKLRSTYVESLPQEVHPTTDRIHCTFNQSVAATGRLSCQNPNLQNIPVRTEEGRKIREAFRPQKEGWCYLGADYSQIELRLLAHFSEDPIMLNAFNNNEDIHATTAASIFNIPLHEVTPQQRYQAKAVNFGIIYGQQAFGLSKELKIEVKEAAAFIEMYFKRYPNIKNYLDSCKEKARKTGRAVTFMGRERLIPEITSKNGTLRTLAERLAVNTPLQGTAADLIKLAMLQIHEKIKQLSPQGFMILQIHDELIFEIPLNEVDIFKNLVQETMQNVFQLKVPLIVDISLGKNWKEC